MKYLHCTPGLVAVFATLMVGLPRAFAEERPSDSVITTWVQAALRDDPRVESTEIKVSTTKGIVTLTGSTSNLASKNYANKEAKKITVW